MNYEVKVETIGGHTLTRTADAPDELTAVLRVTRDLMQNGDWWLHKVLAIRSEEDFADEEARLELGG